MMGWQQSKKKYKNHLQERTSKEWIFNTFRNGDEQDRRPSPGKRDVEKYERKHNPAYDHLFTEILNNKPSRSHVLKERVKKHTGYSTYKTSYLVGKIMHMLRLPG